MTNGPAGEPLGRRSDPGRGRGVRPDRVDHRWPAGERSGDLGTGRRCGCSRSGTAGAHVDRRAGRRCALSPRLVRCAQRRSEGRGGERRRHRGDGSDGVRDRGGVLGPGRPAGRVGARVRGRPARRGGAGRGQSGWWRPDSRPRHHRCRDGARVGERRTDRPAIGRAIRRCGGPPRTYGLGRGRAHRAGSRFSLAARSGGGLPGAGGAVRRRGTGSGSRRDGDDRRLGRSVGRPGPHRRRLGSGDRRAAQRLRGARAAPGGERRDGYRPVRAAADRW